MSKENLFLEHRCPISARLAIFEDDGKSAWLYLCEPESQKPIADGWVYNRIEAPSRESVQQFRGGPPPAAEGFAGETAWCETPSDYEWSFIWSTDGTAVALCCDGVPTTMIVVGERRGFSRRLAKDGPWGHPWSESMFQRMFAAK